MKAVFNNSSNSSSHSNLSDKKLYPDNDHFEFGEPDFVQQTKSNRSKVVVGKIVDRVKKLRQQAPRMSYHVRNHLDSRISLEKHVQDQPYKLAFRYNTAKDLYGTNAKRLFSRFTTTTDDEEDTEISFKNQENALNSPIIRSKKKRYFKRRKQLMVLANFEPLVKERTSFSMSSSSLSFTVTKTRRKRRLITLAHVQKNKCRKRKLNLQQQQQQQQEDDTGREALIKIRHQMLDFKIPADWTCISSKANSSPTSNLSDYLPYQTLISGLIGNIQQLHQEIGIQTDIIKCRQLDIIEYQTKLDQLDQDLLKLHTNMKGMELPANKKSNGYLLKEAYDQNKQILKKNNHTMINSLIRLQHLQIKVQPLHKTDLVWSHLRRWTFPFVALFSVIAAINFLL